MYISENCIQNSSNIQRVKEARNCRFKLFKTHVYIYEMPVLYSIEPDAHAYGPNENLDFKQEQETEMGRERERNMTIWNPNFIAPTRIWIALMGFKSIRM